MRTLTQVWVFFVSMTLILLVIGFQLAGRRGLFVAFILSLVFIYATLHRGLSLFRYHLKSKEWVGHDRMGFFNLLQSLKRSYLLTDVKLHYADEATPPLVWKNNSRVGHILLNPELIEHLTPTEKKILAHFLLAHLSERSFLAPRLLSIFEQGFWGLNYILAPIVHLITWILQFQKQLLRADLKTLQMSGASSLEFGYFLQKLHYFKFHQNNSLRGGEFFSTLTVHHLKKWKTHGLPNLNKRLINVMGFTP